MRPESPAADVARLLGSMAQNPDDWEAGIQAYQVERPLSERECQLAIIFHRSGTILSPLNWLRWIYLEGREFDNRAAVVKRLDQLMSQPLKVTAPTPLASE
jgi:Ser/Thr protein kinase RdoA (MazF antagonist)